jgi:hypothetical protein
MSSPDGATVLVYPEHVDYAYQMFITSYSTLGSSMSGDLNHKVLTLFGAVKDFKRLRFLSTSERWERSDIEDAFGHAWAEEFISLLQFEMGQITKRGFSYYVRNPAILDGIASYVNLRERSE